MSPLYGQLQLTREPAHSPLMQLLRNPLEGRSPTSILHVIVKAYELAHEWFRGIWLLQLLQSSTAVR